jgi:hypothetical protein
MSISYAREKMGTALYALATGLEPLRERLVLAYARGVVPAWNDARQGGYLEPELVEWFDDLERRMTELAGPFSASMTSAEEAQAAARLIVDINFALPRDGA